MEHKRETKLLEKSNCLSYLFFCYMTKVLRKGNNKFLEKEDLY